MTKRTTKAQRPQGSSVAHNRSLPAFFLLASAFLIFLVSWCLGGTPQQVHADSAAKFDAEVAPILQKNCLACHSSASKMGGLVMDSYAALMKGGAHGPVIVPGKADQSRMILMLEGKVQPRMPFGGDPLPEQDIAALKEWVDGGALGRRPVKPRRLLLRWQSPTSSRKSRSCRPSRR